MWDEMVLCDEIFAAISVARRGYTVVDGNIVVGDRQVTHKLHVRVHNTMDFYWDGNLVNNRDE